MSQDFISGLHDDLVEAMDRYERRSPRGRLATGRYPRLLRPVTLMRVAAAAAIIIAVVAAVRTLRPQPQPARPHVAAALEIGGQPIDAATADGSLWVDDFKGSVLQIDPGDRRVVRRIPLPGAPQPVAAGAGWVWVVSESPLCADGRLVRIDASTGRVVSQLRLPFPDGPTAKPVVVGGGVWLMQGGCHQPESIVRRDYAGARTASVTLRRIGALAGAGRDLWALDLDGTLTQIDARTGHIMHRWPGLAPLSETTTLDAPSRNSLVADGAGVWVLSPGRGAILHVRDGRVVQQIAVDTSARPVLAKTRDGLWIATGDRLSAHNRLIRINPGSGRSTGVVELGIQRPIALVPTDDQLCVLTANGKILFVES